MKIVVAFSSPKRSAKTIDAAALFARGIQHEIILLRIIPDPNKVGVIAQLISTDKPMETAQNQINDAVAKLLEQGLNARGVVRRGEVASGINKVAQELGADVLYVGTTNIATKPVFLMKKDPIVRYLVDHCPISLCLVRREFPLDDSRDDVPKLDDSKSAPSEDN